MIKRVVLFMEALIDALDICQKALAAENRKMRRSIKLARILKELQKGNHES